MGGGLFGSTQSICNQIDKIVTSKFKRLKSTRTGRRLWRVGPEAYAALERGVRLVTERLNWPAYDDVQLPIK